MLRWSLRRQLNAEEKKIGESVDYLRHVVDVSPAAMLLSPSAGRFAKLPGLALIVSGVWVLAWSAFAD